MLKLPLCKSEWSAATILSVAAEVLKFHYEGRSKWNEWINKTLRIDWRSGYSCTRSYVSLSFDCWLAKSHSNRVERVVTDFGVDFSAEHQAHLSMKCIPVNVDTFECI